MSDDDKLDNWLWFLHPTNQQEFDAMMLSLDKHLATCGLLPAQRGMNASRLVSMRLGLSGLNTFPSPEQRGAPFSATDLLGRVHDWYRDNYAKRMYLGSAGGVVFNLRGTFWELRLPIMYGTGRLFADRNLQNVGNRLGIREPSTLNALTYIKDLTQTYANTLTDEELHGICSTFVRGIEALNVLDSLKNHELFDHARGDRKLAVVALMDGRSSSVAWWQTAQCAEKIIKGLLARKGHGYPTNGGAGHDISALGTRARTKLGLSLSEQDLATVHCSAAVRYGGQPVSQQDALDAHDALLRLFCQMMPNK